METLTDNPDAPVKSFDEVAAMLKRSRIGSFSTARQAHMDTSVSNSRVPAPMGGKAILRTPMGVEGGTFVDDPMSAFSEFDSLPLDGRTYGVTQANPGQRYDTTSAVRSKGITAYKKVTE